MIHSVVGLGSGIYRYIVLLAQCSNRFDVVVVIVCDKNAENLAEIDANLSKLLADGSRSNAGINKYALHGVSEVVTVATASAAKA